MLKETDLRAVKEVAIKLLHLPIKETSSSPRIVSHPYTSTGLLFCEIESNLTKINLLEDGEAFKRWQKDIEEMIESATSAAEIICRIEKPCRFVFIARVKDYLNLQDLSDIWGSTWKTVELSNMDANLSKEQAVELFRVCNPTIIMDEEEYKYFKNLPDTLTIYRGVTTYNSDNIRALSWTISKTVAKWFATRFSEKGKIYSAKIKKEYVLAYFLGRQESEVIIDPARLTDIKVHKDFST